MHTYGYIRTSRDQEPGHPGSDPHVQRRQLVEAGVEPMHIYADVAASGAKDYNSRDQWHVLDQQLAQGDVLVVVAIDRMGRRYLETMWAIYDLQRRGIRLRSLADSEVQWTKYLDADLDSPEAFEEIFCSLKSPRQSSLFTGLVLSSGSLTFSRRAARVSLVLPMRLVMSRSGSTWSSPFRAWRHRSSTDGNDGRMDIWIKSQTVSTANWGAVHSR